MPSTLLDPDRLDAPGAVSLHVLVLAKSRARHRLLREALARCVPHALIETADDMLDAMLRSVRRPAHLMVLDLTVDAAVAPALIRHLARTSPETAVRVFDDMAPSVPGHFEVWTWGEVDTVLQRWLQGHPRHAARRDRQDTQR